VDERRVFWARANDEAYDFMFERVLPYPVHENGEPLVSLPEAARAADVPVAFSPAPHALGLPRRFFLRQGQIAGFVAAARAFTARGWMLRVEDGFRTRTMQKNLGLAPAVFDAILARVIWELDGQVPSPGFMFRRCSGLVATVPKFGTHLSGSAIDVSVVHLHDPGREVDRGAPYLEMSELTPMDSPFVSHEAARNRRDITVLMRDHGFVAYPYEFWHYSSGDAYDRILSDDPRPAAYGPVDADLATGRVSPIVPADHPLSTSDEIRDAIRESLARRAAAAS
jgi:D-alanyl-D-alanine dipeptidase